MLQITPELRIPVYRYGKKTGTVAVITQISAQRVMGYIDYEYPIGRINFNVKRDEKGFAVSTGSSGYKNRFYFKNAER
jgi:hypothetical protein